MVESQGEEAKRGIFLVANQKSTDLCHNLIFTIRESGCGLPIRVLPYGGEPIRLDPRFADVEAVRVEDFSAEGRAFVAELTGRMRGCSPGLLNRFLAWFGEFDEFVYSDNDIVALMNWEELFPFLAEGELVHADRQFETGGRYNMVQPERFEALLGPGALDRAINAGHIVCRRSEKQLNDLMAALAWMEAHPEVPKWHDQALLCLAAILGQWRVVNLCRAPHGWANSSANQYKDFFEVLRAVQVERRPISHIHYAGYNPVGTRPVDDLIFASQPVEERNRRLLWALTQELSGWKEGQRLLKRARQKVKHRLRRG